MNEEWVFVVTEGMCRDVALQRLSMKNYELKINGGVLVVWWIRKGLV
jgi:hypothetical protein